MRHSLSSELIESLRITLQSLEESFAAPEDQNVIAELKRIILLRIADLEFVGATVELANAEKAKQDASLVPDEDDSDAA